MLYLFFCACFHYPFVESRKAIDTRSATRSVLGTVAAFVATLAAYKFFDIKVGNKFRMGVMAAVFGMVGLSLLQLVVGVFGFVLPRVADYGDVWDALTDQAMGGLTEQINADGTKLTREEQDEFSARSHQLAAVAHKNGVFDDEIVPVEIPQRKGDPIVVSADEGVRGDTTAESLGKLRPAFDKNGTITAGSASQISDGAAAVVVAVGGPTPIVYVLAVCSTIAAVLSAAFSASWT